MMRQRYYSMILFIIFAMQMVSCATLQLPEDSRKLIDTSKMTLWKSQGYGFLIGMQDERVTLFDMTSVSLLYKAGGTLDNERIIIDGVPFGRLERQSDDLMRFTEPDGTEILLNRIDAIPETVNITQYTKDPVNTFDVFWHTITEQSCLLDTSYVDWQAAYDAIKPGIVSDTTDTALFLRLAKLIVLLNDHHAYVSDGGKQMVSSRTYPRSIWMQRQQDAFLAQLATYMDGGALTPLVADKMLAGTIRGDIGYLNLLAFEGFSENGDENVEETAFTEKLDAQLKAWESKKALIIDLRLNSGGSDRLALALGNRLTSAPLPVFSKQARIGGRDEFSALHERSLVPTGVQFLGKPVIVLTSGMTISAADVAAMILKHPALTNITTIGEPTAGAFSNMLQKALPNGWTFAFSNERYLAAYDGQNYESKGIAPDIELFQDKTAFAQGKDNILEFALSQLEK
ncbi:S41 family peptidase [Candidatus Moduliflexus flocculans]|uniref:S41 family peptidase n=1 Tax=Candidatus Moduliflexus flocculans TaxID=1499966 RepID=A0A0S6VPQ7_9BACT|nr:S41 family peptidase [Candidatus Moduliflexus flocculans]